MHTPQEKGVSLEICKVDIQLLYASGSVVKQGGS